MTTLSRRAFLGAAGLAVLPRAFAIDPIARPAGKPWHGEVHCTVDAPEGEPSRWNTLRAMRVLRWADAT